MDNVQNCDSYIKSPSDFGTLPYETCVLAHVEKTSGSFYYYWTCIQEVLGSKFGPETDYPKFLLPFSLVHKRTACKLPGS
jgi:hypothetical protein